MTSKLKALLDAHDWVVVRVVNYDMKVLILLFGIVAGWGVIRGTGFDPSRLLEIMFAFTGLFVSVGWLIQRRLLGQIDKEYVGAIRATADATDPGERDHAFDRLALRTSSSSLRYGQAFSIVVFALLCSLAIWTYQIQDRMNQDMAAMSPPTGEYGGAIDDIPIEGGYLMVPLGAQAAWLLLAGADCAEQGPQACDQAGEDEFELVQTGGFLNQGAAMPRRAVPFEKGSR